MSYDHTNYVFFWKHGIFTNFFEFEFIYDGHIMYSSEQAFMYEKAKMFDKSSISKILSARRPDYVKRLGRQIKNYDDKKWSKVRYEIMKNVLFVKFSNEPLKQHLLNTGDKILVESSPFDKIWGIGLDMSKARNTPPQYWPGKNLLGQALMEVRDQLKSLN